VGIIEGFNHSLERVLRDYKEIMLFWRWREWAQGAEKQQYLPAEEYPYLLLRFYDSYIYYIYT